MKRNVIKLYTHLLKTSENPFYLPVINKNTRRRLAVFALIGQSTLTLDASRRMRCGCINRVAVPLGPCAFVYKLR